MNERHSGRCLKQQRHLKRGVQTRVVSLFLLLGLLFQVEASSLGQKAPAASAATLAEVTGTRDAFIARIHATGRSCSIAAPRILVEDVPSFGQYDDEKNTLRTSDWSLQGLPTKGESDC